jgi:hypothetical protein
MGEREDVHGVMVTLLAGGEQSLFIMLGSDGSISRMGTGSVDNAERDLFIGKTGPEVLPFNVLFGLVLEVIGQSPWKCKTLGVDPQIGLIRTPDCTSDALMHTVLAHDSP